MVLFFVTVYLECCFKESPDGEFFPSLSKELCDRVELLFETNYLKHI